MAYSKIILNDEVLMDVTNDTVEANKLLTGETATAANGQKVTGTLVTSNDFIITLTQNQTSGNWEPDCTFEEAVAAYNAGKKVAFVKTDGVPCAGEYNDFDAIIYYVDIDNYNGSDGSGKKATNYIWNSTGITEDLVSIYYDTAWSNAIPSEVLFGKNFHNASGAQVGTAAARSSSNLTVSGSTVTAPAGFYANAATKSVASGSAQTPATTITANPTITVNSSGLITASASTSKAITPTVSAGYVSNGTAGTITVNGSKTSQLSTQASTTIAPTETTQTAVASGKYTTGDIKIGAIPTTYVGSGVTQRSSSNLTVSGATVTAPAGYYANAATKSVASGTAGTPTAAKGTVSNHSVSVTPSVTNTTGYITGGTKTGTAVSVSASELVSGTKSITENGNAIDVTNYASVDVNVESVNNQNKIVTPTKSQQSITADTGYTGLGTVTMDPIPANYVQVNSYDFNYIDITPSENTQTFDIEDGQIYPSNSDNYGRVELTISNRIGTCSCSFSGLENDILYLMQLNISGNYNNQYFSNYKQVLVMFTNEITTINLNNFTSDGYPIYVDSAIVTKSGQLTVNFNTDITENVFATLDYRFNNNNYVGYRSAYVYAIPSTYVGSGVARKSSSDLTVSGAKITAPAGYYANAATKSVATTTHPAPTASINSNTGLVTASHTQTTGYVTGGTTTGTLQLTTQAAKTVTPTTATQTAVAAGRYTTGAVTVAPIPSAYIIPSGTLSITSNSIYDVTQYASVDVNVPTGRSDAEWILPSQISGVISGSYSTVRAGAFWTEKITAVNLPNATNIGIQAFRACTSLETVSLPAVTTLEQGAFYGCNHLNDVYIPNARMIWSSAFFNNYSLVSLDMPNASFIGNSAFYCCSKLETVSVPKLNNVEASAFWGCSKLKSFYAPSCKIIYTSAFYNCFSLSEVSFPEVTNIYGYAFTACSSLSKLYLPKLTSLSTNAFHNCILLEEIEAPLLLVIPSLGQNIHNLKKISFATATKISTNYAFASCNYLTDVYLPNVSSVSSYTFANCSNLSYIRMQELSSTAAAMFSGCEQLTTVIFDKLVSFNGNADFSNCFRLISLYLLSNSICRLPYQTVFSTTPLYDNSSIAGRWGSIFVPASLYDAYRSATNWTVIADRFVSLTDAEIEALLTE